MNETLEPIGHPWYAIVIMFGNYPLMSRSTDV